MKLSKKYLNEIEKIKRLENIKFLQVVNKLLAKSIGKWKKYYAVEKYKNGEFSFGQAVKFAHVSVWDFPQLLFDKKVYLNFDVEELKSDLQTIKWKKSII